METVQARTKAVASKARWRGMRRESNSPRAIEKRKIYSKACEWAKAPGVCELTGAPEDPASLHVHHILERSTHPQLFLCPWNMLVLLGVVHDRIHRMPRAEATLLIEQRLPGLLDKIRGLASEWHRKPLWEIEELFGGLPPREVFVREEMGLK